MNDTNTWPHNGLPPPAKPIVYTALELETAEIAEIRVRKRAAINAARDTALNAGFTHAGHLYHADAAFQSQVQAYLLAWQHGGMVVADTVNIRRRDNTTQLFGQADLINLSTALMRHVQEIYASSWAQKDAL